MTPRSVPGALHCHCLFTLLLNYFKIFVPYLCLLRRDITKWQIIRSILRLIKQLKSKMKLKLQCRRLVEGQTPGDKIIPANS